MALTLSRVRILAPFEVVLLFSASGFDAGADANGSAKGSSASNSTMESEEESSTS